MDHVLFNLRCNVYCKIQSGNQERKITAILAGAAYLYDRLCRQATESNCFLPKGKRQNYQNPLRITMTRITILEDGVVREYRVTMACTLIGCWGIPQQPISEHAIVTLKNNSCL